MEPLMIFSWWNELAPAWAKITIFLGLWGLAWLPIAIPLARHYQWQPFAPLSPAQKLPLLGSLYLVAPVLWTGLLAIEGQSGEDYGWRWNGHLWQSCGIGISISLGGLGIIYGLATVLGWYAVQEGGRSRMVKLILPLLGLGLGIGGIEEFIFRGLFFGQLQQDYNTAIAAMVSSLIFALLHLIWERELTFPQLPGLWLMGIVLVWARLGDGNSLGLAWGLHAGWIWGLSLIDGADLLRVSGRSPQWVTGIGKQPLAGAMGWVCLLATAILIGQIAQRGGI
jgi:membrane protease YdiL (CAAX protease family)